MKTLNYLCTLLLILSVSCFTGCDNKGEYEGLEKSYDWQLVGDWELGSEPTAPFYVATSLSLKEDGTGLYQRGKLKWFNVGNRLYIKFDNGKKIEDVAYWFKGATLYLSDRFYYTTQLPIIGQWYAANCCQQFSGQELYYFFPVSGIGWCKSFKPSGEWEHRSYDWNRTENGVRLKFENEIRELVCSADATELTIDGAGTYTHTKPFYGQWRAVYNNHGTLSAESTDFSMVEIQPNGDLDAFACTYYENGVKQTLSAQLEIFFNSFYLHIFDMEQNLDAMFRFRFHYDSTKEKVFLELSSDSEYKEYVGYEWIE